MSYQKSMNKLRKLKLAVGDLVSVPRIPTEDGHSAGKVKVIAFCVQEKNNPRNGNVWHEAWIICEIIIGDVVTGRTILNTSQIGEPDYCHPEVLNDKWINRLLTHTVNL